MDLKELTDKVCLIAKEGGLFIAQERKTFDKDRIEVKNANDFVSYVDKETEKLLVSKLSALLPSAGFVTEEATAVYNEEDYCWIIDPLDGTTNFIFDNAPYCVSIALAYKSELMIGVVYEVCRNECFYAWKGGGAYLDGKPLSVSSTSEWSRASVGLDLPYDDEAYKPVLNALVDNLYGKVVSLRDFGSAAMGLCYVAAKRFDVWLEAYIKLWDFAAGAIIVEEAGGKVSGFDGNLNYIGGHHIICTNGLLHDEAVKLVEPFVDTLK